MPRFQKIFPAHAGEIANKLLGVLDRDRLVAKFVDAYVAEHDRRGLKVQSSGYRELIATLGREALLAMVLEVERFVPRLFRPRRLPRARTIESPEAQAFLLEVLAALGRARQWSAAEAAEFRHDLDLYRHLSPAPQKSNRRSPVRSPRGPFVDRCALLLDPSMLEKARGAAGQFEVELERVAGKVLASVFSTR